MSCAHCVDLEGAAALGHTYAKAHAHRLAHDYADEQTRHLIGIHYIADYIFIYKERFEELYMTFRSTHLVNFIDRLYIVHKNTPNLCEFHGLLVQPADANSAQPIGSDAQ
jgi:hypothetical protein